MLLETFGDFDARSLQLLFGLGLGLIFGVAAQISRFCLRRSVVGEDRGSAAAVWLTALGTAIAGFQIASWFGLIEVSDHRYLSNSLPFAAIILGGLAFGIGMVLTRGCVSRLTVLSASGNLRAVSVLAVFALAAHATLKGILAPLRVTLGDIEIDLPFASLAEFPGAAPIIALAVLASAVLLARKFDARARDVILGGLIGLVAVAGWAGTSVLFYDDFDPLAVQSAAFTLPWSDTLFWIIASSAVPAGFGTGLMGGVLIGAFASALLRNELKLQSFKTPAQTIRYLSGGVLMGLGGVLAGGCTVGAGLSGGAMLSVAALLALGAIVLGAVIAKLVLNSSPVGLPA